MSGHRDDAFEHGAPTPDALGTDALIEHILSRYHEVHRAEWPGILALSRELERRGVSPDLRVLLETLAEELEAHMFKEEARLFPMMRQGGGLLIGHLIEDMGAEHRRTDTDIAALGVLLDRVPAALRSAPEHQALLQAVDKLIADLREHMRLEDEVLFPAFRAPGTGPLLPLP